MDDRRMDGWTDGRHDVDGGKLAEAPRKMRSEVIRNPATPSVMWEPLYPPSSLFLPLPPPSPLSLPPLSPSLLGSSSRVDSAANSAKRAFVETNLLFFITPDEKRRVYDVNYETWRRTQLCPAKWELLYVLRWRVLCVLQLRVLVNLPFKSTKAHKFLTF